MSDSAAARLRRLETVQAEVRACRACPNMFGPPIVCPPVMSPVMLVGQAPGPREGTIGRPFGWTAGKTLFRWFEKALGVDEETFRERVYIAAIARCFPGKAGGGGDRKPDAGEIARCQTFLERENALLVPRLVLAVGQLAISCVTGEKGKLDTFVGRAMSVHWLGRSVDVIPLPHPSGASPWHKLEPGKTLLADALALAKRHPAMRAALR